jgi:hypothetical protein
MSNKKQLYMICASCGNVTLDAEEVEDFHASHAGKFIGTCKECGGRTEEDEPDYFDVCPVCRCHVHLKGCMIECDIPVTPDGWAYSDSPFMDSSEEVFWCDKCDHKVPNSWVMGTLSRGQAMAIMKRRKAKHGKKSKSQRA